MFVTKVVVSFSVRLGSREHAAVILAVLTKVSTSGTRDV